MQRFSMKSKSITMRRQSAGCGQDRGQYLFKVRANGVACRITAEVDCLATQMQEKMQEGKNISNDFI